MVGFSEVENLEFKWGRKKGIGGRKKDVQFYESFLYDGVEYWLYDCVYMFRDGVSEPDIGKIIKIWENADKSKKVKILWFLQPSDITNFLGPVEFEENELFLASGEGKGLANINPLEAIAGKCKVICNSTDNRNPQPSNEVIKEADFVFHRTFDVGRQIILDKMDENIAGVEVKNLFNQLRFLEPLPTRKPAENANNTAARAPDSLREDCDGDGSRPHKKIKLENADVGTKSDKSDILSKLQKTNDSRNANDVRVSQPDASGLEEKPKLNLEEKLKVKKNPDGAVSPPKKQQVSVPKDNVKSGDQALKVMKPDDLARSTADAKPLKLSALQSPNDNQKKHNQGSSGLTSQPNNLARPTGVSKLRKDSSMRSQKDIQKTGELKFEVTPRPDDERSKWFVELPWEERIQNAQEEGTLILLQNLDPSYTSAEVEDIVWHAFNEMCTAKMIQRTAFQSPYTGQALVILNTREAAEKVSKKLQEGCLLLPNGRLLVASSPELCFSRKQTSFVGHIALEKMKLQMQREMKEAVSTSHCSQPNTLEYDMAMDWCLLIERSDLALKNLFKQQEREFKKLQANFKTK